MVNGGEADAVARRVLEILPKALISKDRPRRPVHLPPPHAGSDRGDGSRGRGKYGRLEDDLTRVGFPEAIGAGDIGPEAVQVGVAMDEDEVGGNERSSARAREGPTRFSSMGAGHAEGEPVGPRLPFAPRGQTK